MLMNKFSAVETVLYFSLSILCQALAKISYKARGTRATNSEVFSGLTVKLTVILDASLAKEIQIVPVHFTFSYLSGTAVGQGNLTVASYSSI